MREMETVAGPGSGTGRTVPPFFEGEIVREHLSPAEKRRRAERLIKIGSWELRSEYGPYIKAGIAGSLLLDLGIITILLLVGHPMSVRTVYTMTFASLALWVFLMFAVGVGVRVVAPLGKDQANR